FPESVSETSQSSKTLGKRKAGETRLRRNKDGRPKDSVWEDFDTGESDVPFSSTLQGDIPDNLRRHYLIKVAKRNDKINDDSDNKSTLSSSTKPHSYCKPILNEKVNEINKALLKAFVCAGIAFSVIDNPFVRDLFYLLEPGWVPPGRQANQIIQFFKKSHRANRLLRDSIESMKLGSGGLEIYAKTRWASIYGTMSSIVRLKPVFEKILDENRDIISQQAIISLLNDDDDIFYANCHRIASIIQPIKEAIHNLEARTANLADCFVSLGLHKGMFRRICEIAAKFYKSMHNDDVACGILTTQLINYKSGDYPFDFGYDSSKTLSLCWGVIEDDYPYLQNLAKVIFAVVPSQSSCECNFSILRWLYGTYRRCLSSEKIESMAQIHSFYISNLKNELHYYGKELSEGELRDSVLDLTTYADMENNSIELEQDEDVLKSAQSNNDKLEISLIVDFLYANFGGQDNAEELSYTTQRSDNMEFDPVAIVEREFQFFNADLL
ncbi:5813_t:CDS:2, partial [Cetraspora pellucida]